LQSVAVIKFRVHNVCGDGTGSFEVKIEADTTKIAIRKYDNNKC